MWPDGGKVATWSGRHPGGVHGLTYIIGSMYTLELKEWTFFIFSNRALWLHFLFPKPRLLECLSLQAGIAS